ncbi:MAG TPA: carbonic anhydrase [Polyangiales bacterium]|nr:carbonic anhydrase [Polyangiales bacterium]
MQRIVAGVRRFRTEVFPHKRALFEQLAKGQSPTAVVISCADSRVDMQLITQSEPGELFWFRNAGNIVPPYGAVLGAASATIEYALEALEIPNIIVCGHSDCGAMKGLLKRDLAERMPTVASWLRFADVPRQLVLQGKDARAADAPSTLDALVRENVLTQLTHLSTHPAVAVRLQRGTVQLHGWVYDIERGEISAYDAASGCYRPLESQPMPHATPETRSAALEVRA